MEESEGEGKTRSMHRCIKRNAINKTVLPRGSIPQCEDVAQVRLGLRGRMSLEIESLKRLKL